MLGSPRRERRVTLLNPVARPTSIGSGILILALIGSIGRAAGAAEAEREQKSERASPDDALEEETEGAEPARRLPPPRPARPEDQKPAPIPELSRAPARARPVNVAADAGVIWLGARDAGTSYAAGFAWGAHAAVTITPWFWVTPYFSVSHHSVDTGGVPGSEGLRQPAIDLARLGLELSPVWVMSERVRSFVGASLGWARLQAPAAETSGAPATRITQRSGVFVHGSASIGTRFDVVPNLVTLSGKVAAGFTSNQSGSVFSTAQGLDAEGHLQHVAPLSTLAGIFGAFMSVGVTP